MTANSNTSVRVSLLKRFWTNILSRWETSTWWTKISNSPNSNIYRLRIPMPIFWLWCIWLNFTCARTKRKSWKMSSMKSNEISKDTNKSATPNPSRLRILLAWSSWIAKNIARLLNYSNSWLKMRPSTTIISMKGFLWFMIYLGPARPARQSSETTRKPSVFWIAPKIGRKFVRDRNLLAFSSRRLSSSQSIYRGER